MNNNFLTIAIIAAVVIGFIGWTLPKYTSLGGTTADYWSAASFKVGTTEIISSSRGASFTTGAFSSTLGVTGAATLSSTLSVSDEANLESVVIGGDITTLTGSTTVTLTAAQVCDSSVINFPPSIATSSTTLPTTASLIADCLTTNGDTRSLIFRNTGIAASTTVIQVASTTAETLLIPETTGADTTIDGGNSALLTFIRTATTTLVITVTELIDGD